MKLLLCLTLIFATSVLQAATFWGTKIKLGNGFARSFAIVEDKELKKFGVAISKEALVDLPHEMIELVVPMPKVSMMPYRHITLDWNPHGHEPQDVYTLPHFDMHFYYISNTTRQNITCMGDNAPVCMEEIEPEHLAPNYGPTPAGVPKMGWHWVDLLAPEFNGGKFTRTYIYGYYHGHLIFVEPMVTLEYLKSKQTSHNPVRTPVEFPYQEGKYPESYTVSYDAVTGMHMVTLHN